MSDYVKKHGETISSDIRATIAQRYGVITESINREFWGTSSSITHSLYVGSYGRGTAIDTSDIDILVEIPQTEYEKYDAVNGNGQSRLLQAVRRAILSSYPRSDIRGDGQVVKIHFSDEIEMEVLPAFPRMTYYGYSEGYTYPDTNAGGRWLSTNPRVEQSAIKEKNTSSNGLLIDTCKHIRQLRDHSFSSYHLSGIVIDSYVYQAIGYWHWLPPGNSGSSQPGDYEKRLLSEFYRIFPGNNWHHQICAPGSNQMIDATSSVDCLEKILCFMAV